MIAEDAPPGSPVLETRGLTRRFPGVVALDQVSFSLRRGEIHAVIGQNGAGKSTMINIISGMLQPESGEILLSGRPVHIDSTRGAIAHGIATVYQELSLLPNLTIAQNIVLGREPRRRGLLDRAAIRTLSEAALARLGLAMAGDARVGALSLAERQLVEIAKALATSPRVLILDEPTAALAQREVERLFGILRELRAQGIAILYVSHRFAEILDLCDRATILRNGRVVTTTDLAGWTEARLTDAMVAGGSERYVPAERAVRSEPILEVSGLTSGSRVRNASFSVAKGEILVLTGLLGAGQNEIARIVGGDMRPDAGRIVLRGRELSLDGPRRAVQAGICLLTDDRKQEGILPNLSVAENIALPSLSRRRRAGPFVDRAAETRAVLGAKERFAVVAGSIASPMRTLSGGNQQKALLARWQLADVDVFVLIDPTRGVDVAARADIYRRLDTLAASGKAVVVVSSDIPEVLAIADRILVVRDGTIAGETRPGETDEEGLNLLVQGAP
jgi:ribose transport system ATP-binding protein